MIAVVSRHFVAIVLTRRDARLEYYAFYMFARDCDQCLNLRFFFFF